MSTGQRGLGYKFDISIGINPVADLAAGANTGKRIHMRNYESLGILLLKNAASAGTDDVIITLQEHNAATAGTSQNLAAIVDWYRKSVASPLLGTETWTETTQAAAATLTLAGATFAAHQQLVFFEIAAASLSAGFQWLSVNIADPGAGGTILGGVIYIPNGLKMPRRPDLMVQPNL
jgi:hypothetical protein